MSVFPDDLRPDTKHRDEFIPSPLLDLKAETFANPETSCAVANHKAADNGPCWRLEMALDAGIDPAYDLAVENCGERDPVGGARRLLDSLAKLVGRVRITKLAGQFRSRR